MKEQQGRPQYNPNYKGNTDLETRTQNIYRNFHVSDIPEGVGDFDWTELPKAVQGFEHNITFTSVDYNTVSWSSGTIKFYDGTTQAISSGSFNIPTAFVYSIYFNLDDASPGVLKTTTNWISVATPSTGELAVIQRGSDTTINATIIPNKGKMPFISADVIHVGGITLQGDQITAGTINCQNVDIETDSSGNRVIIDAGGLECRGGALDVKTQAGSTQCYVGSDGYLYAGGGTVWLNAAGAYYKGTCAYFRDSNDTARG